MKVLQIKLPDGAIFITNNVDTKAAASCARRYLQQHEIAPDTRPLTVFTELDMTEEEYFHNPATSESGEFFDGCAEK